MNYSCVCCKSSTAHGYNDKWFISINPQVLLFFTLTDVNCESIECVQTLKIKGPNNGQQDYYYFYYYES